MTTCENKLGGRWWTTSWVERAVEREREKIAWDALINILLAHKIDSTSASLSSLSVNEGRKNEHRDMGLVNNKNVCSFDARASLWRRFLCSLSLTVECWRLNVASRRLIAALWVNDYWYHLSGVLHALILLLCASVAFVHERMFRVRNTSWIPVGQLKRERERCKWLLMILAGQVSLSLSSLLFCGSITFTHLNASHIDSAGKLRTSKREREKERESLCDSKSITGDERDLL